MSEHHTNVDGYDFFSVDNKEEEPLDVCETCGAVVLTAQVETHARWHRAVYVAVGPPPNPFRPKGRRWRL